MQDQIYHNVLEAQQALDEGRTVRILVEPYIFSVSFQQLVLATQRLSSSNEQPTSYRHSLFFSVEEEAKEAEKRVREHIAPRDSYIDQDTDGRITYEVRFLTDGKLTELESAGIVHLSQPDSYAINCETF